MRPLLDAYFMNRKINMTRDRNKIEKSHLDKMLQRLQEEIDLWSPEEKRQLLETLTIRQRLRIEIKSFRRLLKNSETKKKFNTLIRAIMRAYFDEDEDE